MTVAPRLRVIGPGRAGGALALALGRAGWDVVGLLGRGEPVAGGWAPGNSSASRIASVPKPASAQRAVICG